jgi:glycosyltransferase involved in cell wall biosynthesis
MARDSSERVRVLRVIARLNAGGPAHHVSLLSGLLDPTRFETLLVAGTVGRGEVSLADVADELEVQRREIGALQPEIDPLSDLRALRALVGIVRDFRPDVVHTHTAKAGVLGRIAACTIRPRPIVVHTYHGHVLEGYFGRIKNLVYRGLERSLAQVSDRLIGVSQATVDDLVRLGVARPRDFSVVPLGLRIEPFLALDPEPAVGPVRVELGMAPDDVLLTFVGRLVPIKRVDVLLDAFAEAVVAEPRLRLAVVGDGELREALEAQATQLGVTAQVRFLGYRRDLTDIVAATDVAVLSSDNEGTPVALIEAGAGGRPLAATDVGGVRDVVRPGTGALVPAGDAGAMATAMLDLAADPERRRRCGAVARELIGATYTVDLLLARVEALYDELLALRPPAVRGHRHRVTGQEHSGSG